ncbi:Kiwa anti-phage protein KwaB-like domain-containing protein, partial [Klebsiella pneumoniae]
MAEEKLDLSELHHDAQKASELSSYYSHFDTKVDDFDLHVYFNFRHKIKGGDGKYRYEYRVAKIDDTTVLKESIKDNVITKTLNDLSSGGVAVSDIKQLSDRASTISFLEDAKSYKDEQMSFLTGIIFDKGFGGDGDIPVVNFEKFDKISKVDSIVFVLRKGDKMYN